MEVGKLGATRQSWRKKSVRDLLIELMDANKGIGEGKLLEIFIDRIREDDEYLTAVAEYAFTNNYHSFVRNRAAAKPRHVQQAEQRAAVETLKQKIVQTVWLNEIMPNGKRMRFCTLDYVWKLGGAYRSIGVKDNKQLVGQKYDEKAMRQKFKTAGVE